jgi:hypothetical protein
MLLLLSNDSLILMKFNKKFIIFFKTFIIHLNFVIIFIFPFTWRTMDMKLNSLYRC